MLSPVFNTYQSYIPLNFVKAAAVLYVIFCVKALVYLVGVPL